LFVKRKVLVLLAAGFCASGALWADDNISQAQDRLAAEGFFQGTRTGVYDSETAAAVTRFQIRNGLAISGKLDAPTAKAFGVSPAATEAEPKVLSGTWKRLRNGQLQFIPKPTPSASVQRAAESPTPSATERDDRLASASLNAAAPAMTSLPAADAESNPDRLRDYVAAFVLAGLELEFFASHVDYCGSLPY
jgi:peptidoglycan hydrolase-like protein with peptidoglycan-binding domain